MPLYSPTALNPDFGGDYFSASSEGASSTTSTSFQTKLTLNVTTTKSGLFILQWYVRNKTSAANKSFEIIIDDENSNVLGRFYSRYPQASTEMPFSGFLFLNLDAEVSKTFNLKYRRVDSTTLTVSAARFAFYKVS